ncbi:hypothetical protein MASR2M29_21940 [Spirochaetota bacterium]
MPPSNSTKTTTDKGQQTETLQELSVEPAISSGKTSDAKKLEPDTEMDKLIVKAKQSIETNHLSEGIKLFISAYARANSSGNADKIAEITATLNEIGTRLSLEPHESWLNPDGSQKNADIRSLIKGSALMPAVYLYENYAYVKSPVPDAFIRFEFVHNSGKLTNSVSTDNKGLANTNINSVDNKSMDAIIRAYPIFTDGKYSYPYKTVFRDFSFVAPPNLVLVAALENSPNGPIGNPLSLNTVINGLKSIGAETVPVSGTLDLGNFNAAVKGDTKALNSLAGNLEPGYFALVHIEVAKALRFVYQGKEYNIYNTSSKASLRIVYSDGSLVFAETLDGIKGQGGTEQAAIDDCLANTRQELAKLLASKSALIKKAFEN